MQMIRKNEISKNLTEKKEEQLCEEKITSIKQKNILTKEIKVRCNVAEAKVRFYKKFFV